VALRRQAAPFCRPLGRSNPVRLIRLPAARDGSGAPCPVAGPSACVSKGASTSSLRTSFSQIEHQANRFCEPLPACRFRFELSAAFARETIELGLASSLSLLPVCGEKAAIFEAMQRGIKRALRHLNDIARYLLQPLRDGIAMNRTQRNNFQNEQVQRALGKIRLGGHEHTSSFYRCIPRVYVEVQAIVANKSIGVRQWALDASAFDLFCAACPCHANAAARKKKSARIRP